MPRLLAADAKRSDDPDLEAPVPAAAASPSPIETAPYMHCVTGTFADPSHESAFAAQLFRMAYPAHVVILAGMLASVCWSALAQPDARRYLVALALFGALPGLVGRVLLHRTGSRDPVRSQRLGSWAWAVGMVLACAVDIAAFITAPASCAAWKDLKYLLPFGNVLLVLVNGSHGLGFTCKFALVAVLLTDCFMAMTFCHDPKLDPWFMCAMGAIVVSAAAAHTAELYLRRSYAEKVRAEAEAVQSRSEEARERRQLEERMEQLQAEKERLLYDMQRRGRPLDDDDDRSAICRGLQAGRSQPYRYPPSLGDMSPGTGPDTDPSEAGGPAPSDSVPTLPPGPPSSGSSGSVEKKQLVAEALADMAMSAVAPQQSVRTATHQPEVHRPIQRATPALCFSKQGLDSTEVAPAASVQ